MLSSGSGISLEPLNKRLPDKSSLDGMGAAWEISRSRNRNMIQDIEAKAAVMKVRLR